MEAIILAGGLGTRLRGVLGDLPKPLAPIAGRPFLEWLIEWLVASGVTRVILSTGHGADRLERAIGDESGGVPLDYVREEQPLGTGGAARLALAAAHSEPVWILNGDTWTELDLARAWRDHHETGAAISLGVRHVPDTERFGRIEIEDGIARSFDEKGVRGPGWINAGIYLVDPSLLDGYEAGRAFSLEVDWLAPECANLAPRVIEAAGFFIDIGVPESYERAQQELPAIVERLSRSATT